MDIHGKTSSWFGNVREKFDNFCSDIDNIINQDPFQYAENQLLTAGANVKQFCSEFMEDVLPESMINSLKEETSPSLGELLGAAVNEEPTKGLSDDSSPSPMEMVENEHPDSSLSTETDVGKELCFEEIRIRDTTFPFEHDDLFQSSSSSRPAEERELSDPINGPFTDLKVELSAVNSPSSILPAKEGEVSEPDDIEISDLKMVPSAVQILDNSSVTTGSNETQYLENQVSSLGHKACKELIDLNDRSSDSKEEETVDNPLAKADLDIVQSSRTEMIGGECIILESCELCLTPDLPKENSTSQGTVCKSCLTTKFNKACECRKATSSIDGAGKSYFCKSERPDEDFCESDWVIV